MFVQFCLPHHLPFPVIGKLPINAVRPRDIIEAVRTIEQRGAIDSARRVLGYIGQIYGLQH